MKGKICIIGGGPAGLSAALQGARLGYQIRLLEKGAVGDGIRCAEGFIDTLGLLGRPQAGVRFKVEKMVITAENTYELDVQKNRHFYMIDRREWQEDLAERAAQLGAEICEHVQVSPKDLLRLKEEYDYVIDASGVFSLTARAYGFLDEYRAARGLTVTRVLEGNFSHLAGKIKVALEPNYFGYYWIFPKGKDKQGRETANVGLGCFNYGKWPEESVRLWEKLDAFIEREGLRGYGIVRSFGGVLPTKMLKRIVFDNILLVGDASGLCSPLHGGGIDLACITGKMAIDAIAAGEASSYQERVLQTVGRKLQVEEEVAGIWEKMDKKSLDKLVRLATQRGALSLFNAALPIASLRLHELKTIGVFMKEFLFTTEKEKWFESF